MNIAEIPVADLATVTVYTDALLPPSSDALGLLVTSLFNAINPPTGVAPSSTWDAGVVAFAALAAGKTTVPQPPYSSPGPGPASPALSAAMLGMNVFSLPLPNAAAGQGYTPACRTTYGNANPAANTNGNQYMPLCAPGTLATPSASATPGTPASYLVYAGTLVWQTGATPAESGFAVKAPTSPFVIVPTANPPARAKPKANGPSRAATKTKFKLNDQILNSFRIG